ncbi:hypothetical protein HOG27_00695 [bacterium]|nr:hypothetical protein [bacterium]
MYVAVPSFIKKLACLSEKKAHHILFHFNHTSSISFQAEFSLDGFLKKLPQVFPFGCLCSLKYKLSTSEEYFSTNLDKSNCIFIIKYLFVSLIILVL